MSDIRRNSLPQVRYWLLVKKGKRTFLFIMSLVVPNRHSKDINGAYMTVIALGSI